MAGRIRPPRFGVAKLPAFVLTTEGAGSILSIERIADEGRGGALYKVFSRDPLDEAAVCALFEPVAEVTPIVWQAYPKLPPVSPWPAFRPAPRLYYPSAMEFAVSTMETQAIAGTAAANLLAADAASTGPTIEAR